VLVFAIFFATFSYIQVSFRFNPSPSSPSDGMGALKLHSRNKTSEAMLRKKDKGPASLFCREAEVLFGALKTKSCLSEASSFCLA